MLFTGHSDTHLKRGDPSRACWTCHWWVASEVKDSGGACVNPDAGAVHERAYGCSLWMRETGADDEPANTWKPVALPANSQAVREGKAERERLARILQLAQRWIPPQAGFTVGVLSRVGLIGIRSQTGFPKGRDQLEAAIARSGINAAVRAGKI